MVEWIIAGVVVIFFLVTLRALNRFMRHMDIRPGNRDILYAGLITLLTYGVLRYLDWNPLHLAAVPVAMLVVFLIRRAGGAKR